MSFLLFRALMHPLAAAAQSYSIKSLTEKGLVGVSFPEFAGLFLRGVMGLMGSLSLLMFIYGALLWMTAMGVKDKVTKAKSIFVYGALGLVVIFGAYTMANFLFSTLGGASQSGGAGQAAPTGQSPTQGASLNLGSLPRCTIYGAAAYCVTEAQKRTALGQSTPTTFNCSFTGDATDQKCPGADQDCCTSP